MSEKKVVRARDVMRDGYIEVDGMMTVKEAIREMRKANVKTIMVKKRSPDDAHGIVLLSDIAKFVLAKDRSPDRVNVYEIMTKPAISVPPSMDVRYCARLFNRYNLSVTPVIENDEVVGVLSYGEMVLHGLFKLYDY